MRSLSGTLLLLLWSIGVCNAQVSDIRHYIDCERGVSFVSNAGRSHDGRAVVVGDLGRLGVIGTFDQDFTWYCLPEQPFLYDGWIENDSIVVVGERGSVWFRTSSGVWKNAGIPTSETCRAITKQGSSFYVGTEQGSIWECGDLGSFDWRLQTVMPSSILDLYADDTSMVAVGGEQGLYEWSRSRQEWVDLSEHVNMSLYSAVLVFGGKYIIGADSGRVVRYDRTTRQQAVSQLFPPSVSDPYPDFRGRNDRTLSICEGAQHELLVTGHYRDGSRPTTGVYSSSDSGVTWKHRPFYDASKTFEWFSTEYCPVVLRDDSIIAAIVATAGSPIVVYRSSNSGETWRKSQSTSMYQLLPRTSNIPDSTWHTFVDGISGIVVDPQRQQLLTTSYCVPQNSDDYRYPFTQTLVVLRTISQEGIRADTLSVVSGKYRGLQRNGEKLIMSGDSLRLAVSDDDGRTWTISRIDSLQPYFFTATQIMLKSGSVAYAGNVGYVYLEDVGRWESMKLRSDSTTRPFVVNARKYSENSALIEVDYYQQSTLLYRTVQLLKVSGSSYSIDSVATIPARAVNMPALYTSSDTVVILMASQQSSQFPMGQQYRCSYVGNEWRCDTMYIVLDNGSQISFRGTDAFEIYDHGVVVVGQLFSGGKYYSTDHCRTWRVLPHTKTFFTGPLWATALAEDRLYVVGYNYMLASIALPRTTSVSDDRDTKESKDALVLLREYMAPHQEAIIRVSSLFGTELFEAPANTFAQAVERISLLSNGVYAVTVSSDQWRVDCVIIVVDGELYAHTVIRESPTR